MRKLHLAVLSATAMTLGSFSMSANADIIAGWTFENSALVSSPATAAGANTVFALSGPESGAGTASGFHATATAYSAPSGNGSVKSTSSNQWSTNDYYEFDVSTVGESGVSLTFDQTGSATGPKQFKIETSADNGGSWINLAGGAYSIATSTGTTGTASNTASVGTVVSSVNWSPTVSSTATTLTFDLSSITGLTGIRIVDVATSAIGTATAIGTAGTDRVDNVIFSGTAVPEPATVGIAAAGAAFMIGRRRRAR